jgi:hypothetical protein
LSDHEPVWTPEALQLTHDDWAAVRRLAAAQHPDMGIGYKLCRMLMAGTLIEVPVEQARPHHNG